jgi:citrate lyase beta subunit
VTPYELGASLYVPASRADLAAIGNGLRIPGLRSVIFCTEDAIRADQVEGALDNLSQALPALRPGPTRCFVRARNPSILRRLLALNGVERLSGVVLPKVSRANLHDYLDPLQDHPSLRVMPTLECADTFDPVAMRQLRRELEREGVRERILSLRIGANDLMGLLGTRRSPRQTIYETVLGPTLSMLATVFRPAGFNLTGPVFEGLAHPEVLALETWQDLQHGLFGKTAIHPQQVPIIESVYGVDASDLEQAVRMLDDEAPAVFRMGDVMCEPTTHQRWAVAVRERARLYGTRGLDAGESELVRGSSLLPSSAIPKATAPVMGATRSPARGAGMSSSRARPSSSAIDHHGSAVPESAE